MVGEAMRPLTEEHTGGKGGRCRDEEPNLGRLCLRSQGNIRRDVMSLGQQGTGIWSSCRVRFTGCSGSHTIPTLKTTTTTIKELQLKLTFSWMVPDRQVGQHRAQPLTRLWTMMSFVPGGDQREWQPRVFPLPSRHPRPNARRQGRSLALLDFLGFVGPGSPW